MYIFGLFYGWKKAWATLKPVSFRGLIFKISDEHPHPFNMRSSPPPRESAFERVLLF